MVVFRARCVYSGAVVALKGYSREMLVPQTRERIYNEVQTLQVRMSQAAPQGVSNRGRITLSRAEVEAQG